MSTATIQMNSTSEKELLEKFGQFTKWGQPNPEVIGVDHIRCRKYTYIAYWLDGFILGWDRSSNRGNGTIWLHNSHFITMGFLNQIVKSKETFTVVTYFSIMEKHNLQKQMII
ncbi:15028_t:CDS:2 [Funneliformis caledonium]|uniref:15028_t:CDS:1 n=1 Tax=Funneliformis caledonium TaxID=1117310 RepID=A0A9N9EXL5_9GLOM|nr:15028_t:CDS:2 [Funneliformis caledonium]